MSYSSGIEAMTRGRGSKSSVSGFFTSSDEVRWHLDQTNADMNAFRNDVLRWAATSQKPDDKDAVQGFKVFFNRWQKFYTDARTRFPRHEIIEQSENWRRRLIGWRQAFIARDMAPTTPNPELVPQKAPWIHSVLVGAGGALLGAYLTDKLVRRKKG